MSPESSLAVGTSKGIAWLWTSVLGTLGKLFPHDVISDNEVLRDPVWWNAGFLTGAQTGALTVMTPNSPSTCWLSCSRDISHLVHPHSRNTVRQWGYAVSKNYSWPSSSLSRRQQLSPTGQRRNNRQETTLLSFLKIIYSKLFDVHWRCQISWNWSCHSGARKWTGVLWKHSQCSYHLSHLSSPNIIAF